MSDSDNDSDEYENALEDVEIDQTSDLYKTIVAAIIEEEQQKEKVMPVEAQIEENVDTGVNTNLNDVVPGLLEEAAKDVSKRYSFSWLDYMVIMIVEKFFLIWNQFWYTRVLINTEFIQEQQLKQWEQWTILGRPWSFSGQIGN